MGINKQKCTVAISKMKGSIPNILFYLAAQRLALVALGRTAERRPNGKKLRRGKCLKTRQNPQRPLHAVLAALLILAEKLTTPKYCFFGFLKPNFLGHSN